MPLYEVKVILSKKLDETLGKIGSFHLNGYILGLHPQT